MDNVQKTGRDHDCAVCQHFRRGIGAAEAAGNATLANDGRTLLKHHRNVVALDGPWAPIQPVR